MPDATLNSPEADPVVSIDIQSIQIFPLEAQVIVELIFRRQSGAIARRVTERFDNDPQPGAPANADFAPCLASFCQAAPKKKLLQYLATKGRLAGATVT